MWRIASYIVLLVTFIGVERDFAQTSLSLDELANLEVEAITRRNEWTGAAFNDSIRIYSQLANQWELRVTFSRSADCLREIALLELARGNIDAAERTLFSALRKPSIRKEVVDTLKTRSLLALVTLRRNQSQLAEIQIRDALESTEQIADPSAIAHAYFSAAALFEAKREFSSAQEFYEKAIASWDDSGNVTKKAYSLVEASFISMARGEPLLGMERALAAKTIFESTGDRRGLAFSLIAIGHLSSVVGDKQKALDYYAGAEKLFPDDLDSYELASLYNGFGFVYEELDDLPLSLKYRQKALELFHNNHHLFGELSTLPSLMELSFHLGNTEAGLSYFSRAKSLSKRLNDTFWLGIAQKQMADHYLEIGSYDEALITYNKSLNVLQKAGLKVEVAHILTKIGIIHEKSHEFGKARASFDASLKISNEITNRMAVASSLYDLARLNYLEDNLDQAVQLSRESIAVTEKTSEELRNTRLRRNYSSAIFERYELLINRLMKSHFQFRDSNSSKEGIRVFEKLKGRSVVESLVIFNAGAFADADPEMVNKEKEIRTTLNAKSDKLTELLSGSDNELEAKKLEGEINDLENQLEEIRAELKQKSPIYSAIKSPEPFDVVEFQREVLGENDLLLEFSLGKEESYLWAVDKRDVTAYYLPPREAIEARVEKLRGLLGSRQLRESESFEDYQRRVADAEIEYKTEARILSSELLGQAADKLAGKKLIVVADGRLHYFPLGSLPMPNSESDDPILLTNEVVYEPSASALKIFRMEKKAEARPQKDLLVFADPVFSKTDERIAGLDTSNTGFVSMILPMFRSIESLESMPRLPASSEEAKSISDVVGANQTTLRAGFAANRDSVLSGGIEDYKILHFATHGLIDEKRPELSGILLSLFNDEGKRRDGGFIRLQDVYGLRLNSDLVVLSACDTGIGKEIKGEGVMSLNNAFLQAGAKSVVSSLWKVDDTATKDLMTEFYRGMADDNLTAAAALRQAQIKMYNDPRYRSPFYWAAFTASGDAGVKVAFTSYAWLYALITAAAIAAALLTLFANAAKRRKKIARGEISGQTPGRV